MSDMAKRSATIMLRTTDELRQRLQAVAEQEQRSVGLSWLRVIMSPRSSLAAPMMALAALIACAVPSSADQYSRRFGGWVFFCHRDSMTDKETCLLRFLARGKGQMSLVISPGLGVAAESPRIAGAMIRIGQDPARRAVYCDRGICMFARADAEILLRDLPGAAKVLLRVERWDGTRDDAEIVVEGLRDGIDAMRARIGESAAPDSPSPPDPIIPPGRKF